MVVEDRELRRGKGQRVVEQVAREQRRRARDAVGDQQREHVRVVVGAVRPVGARDLLAAGRDDPLVAVDQPGVADLADQRLQLVRVPDVILVGERDVPGTRRDELERPLEVVVEAAPPVGARDDEPIVAVEHAPQLGEPPGVRAVVAHDADPVGERLRPDRLHLSAEQLERGLERRHRDRHERCAGDRLGRLGGRDAPERGRQLAAVAQPRAQAQLERPAVARPDAREAPEAGAVARRLVGRFHQVEPGHAVRHQRLLLAVDEQGQRGERPGGREARAADEQRRPRPDRQRPRERRVEPHVQLAPARCGGLGTVRSSGGHGAG